MPSKLILRIGVLTGICGLLGAVFADVLGTRLAILFVAGFSIQLVPNLNLILVPLAAAAMLLGIYLRENGNRAGNALLAAAIAVFLGLIAIAMSRFIITGLFPSVTFEVRSEISTLRISIFRLMLLAFALTGLGAFFRPVARHALLFGGVIIVGLMVFFLALGIINHFLILPTVLWGLVGVAFILEGIRRYREGTPVY